ncbi:Phosphomevalonate kinase [Trichostrongylus colubriformis]|uniref:Phosphomevalonate kinase n=1 Tax=Trichostrongylus colubriformis TaxID=6319 RepID=A0AAN8FRF4_TRICO
MVRMVVLFSGKRKSGKDYCSEKLKEALSPIPVSIYGVSHILKALYAEDHGLNYSELVSDGPYKEIHRSNMIRWGEGVRSEQPDFFCRATIPTDCTDDVVIISDCRRPSDIEYFQNNYETLKVRITASDEERKRRGFEFVDGIDDMPSECALDDYPHDFVIINDSSCNLGDQLHAVVHSIQRVLSS